jgi:Prokaryotic E2 family E
MWKFIADLLGLPPTSAASSTQPAPFPQAAPLSQPPTRKVTVRRQRADRRSRYIQTQAYQLAERFSKDGGEGIQLDEQGYNWLIIPKYPMPERWRQRWTKLMILFPAAYPDVPPTGFYLTIRARLKNGGQDRHLFKGGGFYAEAPDLSKDGWFWYCVHAQMQGAGGWQPSSDPAYPDNLYTFLNMAREALTADD